MNVSSNEGTHTAVAPALRQLSGYRGHVCLEITGESESVEASMAGSRIYECLEKHSKGKVNVHKSKITTKFSVRPADRTWFQYADVDGGASGWVWKTGSNE